MILPGSQKLPRLKVKLVMPHDKHSRAVTDHDIKRVIKDAKEIQGLMNQLVRTNFLTAVYAISHAQVTKKDPLRFFVINNEDPSIASEWNEPHAIVCNPIITQHTQVPTFKEEGCATFPRFPMKKLPRFNACHVEYQLLDNGRLLPPVVKNFSGRMAQLFQHEIDHMNAIYIHRLPDEKGKKQ